MKQATEEYLKDYFIRIIKKMEITDLFDREEIITFVSKNFKPDDIFSYYRLKEWASKHFDTLK